MTSSLRPISAALLALLPAYAVAAEGNAVRGRRLFQSQCAACHTATAENRVTGPGLAGVFGRKAAASEGFAYSEALKKSDLTWDAATLEKFFAGPTQLVPGTTMVQVVNPPSARADIIAYLNTLKPAAAAAPTAPAK
jgi:cytochrome c2